MKWLWIGLGLLLLAVVVLSTYLFRPLAHAPQPAAFQCLDLSAGSFVPLGPPEHAYGVGLSYAGHIAETASEFDPNGAPPVFKKDPAAFATDGQRVAIPSSEAMCEQADQLEPGLGGRLRDEVGEVAPLLDYETELGFVLLEDIDPSALEDDDYVPKLGFFIANDLSARSLAILGEGRPNRYAYWGASKSFPGFMPAGSRAWVPDEPKPNGVPCVTIQTRVNGEVRQQQNTQNLIYTPAQMLGFIHDEFPERPLRKGDVVLTGTPAGVAAHVPRHLLRLANLVGLDRFAKLEAALSRDRSKFLSEGDVVVVEGEGLGSVSVTIAPPGENPTATSAAP